MLYPANKEAFLQRVKKHSPKVDIPEISRAYDFAEKAHHKQLRDDGRLFITHPAGTSLILAEMGLDTATVVAGLLHDSVEDSPVTVNDIKAEFGNEVAVLVRGCTKIKQQQEPTEYKGKEWQIQTLQRMFLAMAKDVRVVLVKLADRLHNMHSLDAKSKEDQMRIAQHTMDIYAPIANRLGIGEIRGQLEDLSFKYLNPEEYTWVVQFAYKDIQHRKQIVNELRDTVEGIMKNAKIRVLGTDGRVKHKYSLYRKLLKYNKDLAQIHDLVALRLVVPDVSACYETIGILHEHYRPLPGRIKDYIATPKPNGYRSLHTTVCVKKEDIVEFQIRTPEMHDEAEYGIASHWRYKEKGISALFDKKKPGLELSKRDLEWVNKLSRWKYQVKDEKEYVQSLKIDFFKDRIYARTPAGDVFDLPDGASPLDFAYRIHTEVGNNYTGAKVNGSIVRMNYAIRNEDVVEIITAKNSPGPKPKWVDYVKTSNARNKIRAWLRKKDPVENTKIGREMLDHYTNLLAKINFTDFYEKLTESEQRQYLRALDVKDLEGLYECIGNGSLPLDSLRSRINQENHPLLKRITALERESGFQPEELQKRVTGERDTDQVIVNNDPSIQSTLALCCQPKPGDSIIGYLTKKKGITVHRTDCRNINDKQNQERSLQVVWSDRSKDHRKISIKVLAKRQTGALSNLSTEIYNMGIGVSDIQVSLVNDKQAVFTIQMFIENLSQIRKLVKSIEGLDYVENVKRV